jgi:hypothetical protein
MELKIDQQLIADAINKTASKALESSLCGYEVQVAIASVVTREVAEGAIAEAIKQAVQQVDTAALTQALAVELQRATVRATVAILQDGLMTTICKLRGIGDYSTEDKEARAKLRAELFSA